MERKLSAKVETVTDTRHSMFRGGCFLVEEVEEIIERPLRSRTILSRTIFIKRAIDNQSMYFKMLADGTEVEDEEEDDGLTQKEKQRFMRKWNQLWKPSASRKELIKAMVNTLKKT